MGEPKAFLKGETCGTVRESLLEERKRLARVTFKRFDGDSEALDNDKHRTSNLFLEFQGDILSTKRSPDIFFC